MGEGGKHVVALGVNVEGHGRHGLREEEVAEVNAGVGKFGLRGGGNVRQTVVHHHGDHNLGVVEEEVEVGVALLAGQVEAGRFEHQSYIGSLNFGV